MSTEVNSPELTSGEASYDEYRAVCAAAVTSLLFGLLSVVALLNLFLGLIPLLGIMMGLYALAQIKQRPNELTGSGLAVAGITLSSVLLITSWVAMTVIYFTEVPEGYTRISYSQLQPEEGRIGQLVPPLAEQLDGKPVFIKGYIYPGKQLKGIKRFLLVRDKGDCCFGGNPKLTDRIQVTLADSQRLTFSSGRHKIAGTFRISKTPGQAVDAVGSVFYYLDESQLR